MADQPAKKQKTDVETMGISEMRALIKSMDMAEFLCETGDGVGVNLLDRPAEQIAGAGDDEVRDAGLVNTIRRGLREFGFSA